MNRYIDDILQFQNNDNFIERISADENLTIFIKMWDGKHISIIFKEYYRININFNVPAEIGEIELIREANWEIPNLRGLARLIIRDPWDEEVIFIAYVGNYVIEKTVL